MQHTKREQRHKALYKNLTSTVKDARLTLVLLKQRADEDFLRLEESRQMAKDADSNLETLLRMEDEARLLSGGISWQENWDNPDSVERRAKNERSRAIHLTSP